MGLKGSANRAASLIGGLVFLLVASFVQPSLAGLSVSTTVRVELSDADALLIGENPALRDLSSISPELLRKALDLIAEARSGKEQGRGVIRPIDPSDAPLVDQNPVLREIWQSSPEASADLLQLLKSAAGGKSQK